MLKITNTSASANEQCLSLEGRLVGPWVAILEDAVCEIASTPVGIRLDLSTLQFVDAEGLVLLRALRQNGAVLWGATPFIEELLRDTQP